MAILDAGLLLSDAQAVTATAASTNVIDLSAVAPNLGRGGEQIYVQVVCNTTTDSSGDAAVLAVTLEHSADNSSFVQTGIGVTGLAQTSVTAGDILLTAALPPTLKRYVRVYYTVSTANYTAGKFDAYLTTGPNK